MREGERGRESACIHKGEIASVLYFRGAVLTHGMSSERGVACLRRTTCQSSSSNNVVHKRSALEASHFLKC